jgi:hypothetical protein
MRPIMTGLQRWGDLPSSLTVKPLGAAIVWPAGAARRRRGSIVGFLGT